MDYLSSNVKNINNFKNYICKFNNNEILSSFLLKADVGIIEYINNTKTISLKNISYFSNDRAALLLLFKFADNNDLIYGKWFNYSSKIDKEHLEMMLFQKEIPIILNDSTSNKNYTFYTTNDFSLGIKEHIKKSYKVSMNDFCFKSYIEILEKDIKSLPELWNSIDA